MLAIGSRQKTRLWLQTLPTVGSICMQVFLWTITQMQRLCLYQRSLKSEDPDNFIYHLVLNWSDLELTEPSLLFLASHLWDMWPHSVDAILFCCRIFSVCAKHTSFLMSPGVVRLSVPASAYSFQSLIVKHDTQHKEENRKPCPAAPRHTPSFPNDAHLSHHFPIQLYSLCDKHHKKKVFPDKCVTQH